MALTDMYLQTTKNLEAFLNSLLSAQAPERFTQKFLESLEFKSINDRLFIKMLKELGFLDASGIPTARYSEYLDQSQSKVVLADSIRSAYSDLFKVNTKANELSETEVKNKFKSLTGGKKSDNVYTWMAKTFVALCSQSDFSTPSSSIQKPNGAEIKPEVETQKEEDELLSHSLSSFKPVSLHYNIQIILPDTRDIKVYDAIFFSLKKHLG